MSMVQTRMQGDFKGFAGSSDRAVSGVSSTGSDWHGKDKAVQGHPAWLAAARNHGATMFQSQFETGGEKA